MVRGTMKAAQGNCGWRHAPTATAVQVRSPQNSSGRAPVLAQKSIRPGILSTKIAVGEIRLLNRASLSCHAVSVHGF